MLRTAFCPPSEHLDIQAAISHQVPFGNNSFLDAPRDAQLGRVVCLIVSRTLAVLEGTSDATPNHDCGLPCATGRAVLLQSLEH